MTAYEALHDEAKEIMAEMKYKGYYWIETEAAEYGGRLRIPGRKAIDIG